MEKEKKPAMKPSPEDLDKILISIFSSKWDPLPTDDRLFVGDIPKQLINRFDWLEAEDS